MCSASPIARALRRARRRSKSSLKLLKMIPPEFMLHAHHWLILHGRYTCLARKPLCERCIINGSVPLAGENVLVAQLADAVRSINSGREPDKRLWRCTMIAMPNRGVARLTIGIDTNAAMNSPPRTRSTRCALRIALASATRAKAHRGELEIFAAEDIGGGEEEHEHAGAGEEDERQRDQIDQDREQRGLGAFDQRAHDRQSGAEPVGGIVHTLDLFGDVIDEDACDQ